MTRAPISVRRVAMAALMALPLSAAAISPAAHAQTQAPAHAADQRPVRALTGAYNAMGQSLAQLLAATPGNVVVSPYSVGSAMAMVLSGARGDTRAEMEKALRHTLPAGEIDAANAAALAILRGYERSAQPSASLRVANALMTVKPDAAIDAQFERVLKEQYAAEMFRNVGLADVNKWVSEKTEGKIDKILDKLSSESSHILLNAIYFKAPWAVPFAKEATEDEDFSVSAQKKIAVPMMNARSTFALVGGDGFKAAKLPYAVQGLAMIVVRPDEVDGIAKVQTALNADALPQLIKSLAEEKPRPVALALPRFKTGFGADLVAPFKALGLTKVFDAGQSDLSGITGQPREKLQAFIEQIAHRAVIEVTEEGTEAAAVTAVVVGTRSTSAAPQPEAFQVDRPFLFYIVDDASGAILFQGRIVNPLE